MNNDYLWDRHGTPDPEITRLEELLGQFRLAGQHRYSAPAKRRSQLSRWMPAVAAAVLIAGAGLAVAIYNAHTPGAPTPWQLSVAGGKPRAVRAGQRIVTAEGIRATMESEFTGRIDIEEDSRLRLLSSGNGGQRFALDHGTIHALIWAPPAKFVVDTPAAQTVDLGCQYTLRVAKDGAGFLTVETGWVAFEWRNLESFIPAGAACTTRPGHGPDTPYFLDAPRALTAALSRFDTDGDWSALQAALPTARERDALTLWHLLERTHGTERGEVFDRFATLVTLPPGVSREAILRGDRSAFDGAWDALDLGDTSWWREWKRQW
jgi:hypothetical protein